MARSASPPASTRESRRSVRLRRERWDFLPVVEDLICGRDRSRRAGWIAPPDQSSLAPCSRRPGRCAPARSAGAAARPPGPRLRAALCRSAGRDGRMSAPVEQKDGGWVTRSWACRDRGRTIPVAARGRRRPRATDRRRHAGRGHKNGRVAGAPRGGRGSSGRARPPHGPGGRQLGAAGPERRSACPGRGRDLHLPAGARFRRGLGRAGDRRARPA
jgi:hypothetical protein